VRTTLHEKAKANLLRNLSANSNLSTRCFLSRLSWGFLAMTKKSGEEKQEEENGEEEESDEEEGDEDEIEESDGAAEVTASSADDAAEPERKADISERLKRKHPGSAGVSGREE
jgi:hypothetical protein